MKKVLVCGATGFIGKNTLLSFSKKKEYKVYAVYNKKKPFKVTGVEWIKSDLREYNNCLKVTKNKDIVFQLAATTSGSNVILNTPYLHVTDNAIMNSYLLRASFHNDIEHFIFTSCTVMYSNSKKPLNESQVSIDKIYPSYFGVANTKLYIEKMCEFFSRISKCKFTVIRHSNIYGPFDKFNLSQGHFIGSSFAKVLNKNKKNIEIFGNGSEMRDYLYIDDLTRFFHLALKNQKNKFEIFNCTYGKSYKIIDVLKRIKNVCNSNKVIKKIPSKNTLKVNILVNSKKAKKHLKWKPKVSLLDGLTKTYLWLKKNEKFLQK